MFNIIKNFFAYLLPIVRQAVTQAAADELYKAAYPDRRTSMYRSFSSRPRPFVDYSRVPRQRVGKNPFEGMTENRFHDVIMVALDITGPNTALVRSYLEELMPECGEQDNGINVDSWWIADETVGTSDLDCAVFVSKGNQDAARALLRDHGLVN